MGEPGTKELLTLEELEASAGVRTGRKHILSILVENKPGVLTRIAGPVRAPRLQHRHARRRPDRRRALSRITLTLDGAMHPIDQVTKQLHKLVNVIKIRDLEPADTVARELALFKVSADGGARGEVMQIVEIFRGKIIDVTRRSRDHRGHRHVGEDRGVRAHGAPVRPGRDGPHRRDRDLARPRRDLTGLHFRELGEGQPVVLLHAGPGLDGSIFLPSAEALAVGLPAAARRPARQRALARPGGVDVLRRRPRAGGVRPRAGARTSGRCSAIRSAASWRCSTSSTSRAAPRA